VYKRHLLCIRDEAIEPMMRLMNNKCRFHTFIQLLCSEAVEKLQYNATVGIGGGVYSTPNLK